MGQKVNPHGLRIGIIKDWDTKWYANKKHFSELLIEDYNIRNLIKKKLFLAGVSRIEIERAATRLNISIRTAKPGIAIGKNGQGKIDLEKEIEKLINADGVQKTINVNIVDIKHIDLDAQLVAENIASQLEKRISFRRAMKQCMSRAMKAGAKGIKTSVSGRLGGAEIARTEHYHEGTIPLQTLRADIDYGFWEANTTAGKIGVKVWIYKGEVLPAAKKERKVEGGN